VIERDTIKVVKIAHPKDGRVLEFLKGKWKNHIAVDLYEDPADNLIEAVTPGEPKSDNERIIELVNEGDSL